MAIIVLREAGSVQAPDAVVKGLPLTNLEVDNNFSNISITVGNVTNLTTVTKANIVFAINEVATAQNSNISNTNARVTNVESNVQILFGNIANAALRTDITNVNSNVTVTNSNIGVIANLLTPVKANTVNAINQIFNLVANGTLSGTVITNSTWSGNTIAVAQGGTGATDAANARTNIGLGTIAIQNSDNVTVTGGSINGNTSINVSANITASFFLGDGSRLSNVSGSGSGAFNTSISGATGAALGTSLANVYVAPSTANTRYIIHSIQVTNINGFTLANVSGNFNGSLYSNISLAKTIPVPAGATVELLKKPKVLSPTDYLQMEADAASTLHATVTVEKTTTALHFGSGLDLTTGAAYTNLYIANANSVIESVLLSNDDGVFDVKAKVAWTNGADVIQGYYCYELIIPADSTIELLDQPKFLESGYKVQVYSNVGGRLEAMIAGKTIGS